MSENIVNVHVLDAAYKPFPTFDDWAARTTIDTVRWDRYNSDLAKHAEGLSPDVLDRARNVAKRAAALDTGAIEGLYEVDRGFTYTVAVEAAAWEAALALKGEQVRSLFEAQLHAYDYVLDLATKAEPISEAAIRALHEEVCRAQDTYKVITSVGPQDQALPKGQYKALPNHVRTRKGTDHSYAPVDVTPAEMARLVAEMRTDFFLKAHPVAQAAYAHYGLVVIHPFADGNGRVARALASAFTYRAVRMPIVILSAQKIPYLDALESADAGDFQRFQEFIHDRCLDTITLVDASLRAAVTPTREQSIAAIESLYVTRGGYTHEQVDEAGIRLQKVIHDSVAKFLSQLGSSRVAFNQGMQSGYHYPLPAGYRFPITGPQSTNWSLHSAAPASAAVQRVYGLILPNDAAGDDDIAVVRYSMHQPVAPDAFTARVDELIPIFSGMLQMRIDMFAERVANEMLEELTNQAERTLGKNRGA